MSEKLRVLVLEKRYTARRILEELGDDLPVVDLVNQIRKLLKENNTDEQ
jgi:hypothetical protein